MVYYLQINKMILWRRRRTDKIQNFLLALYLAELSPLMVVLVEVVYALLLDLPNAIFY